jgi:hypothetical protein
MYVARGDSVQRQLTSGPVVASRPAFESVRAKNSWTHVYMRWERLWRWRKSLEAELIGRLTTWLGQQADHHLVSYNLGQVGGAPP